jgi:carbon-monoxide dehydrogenase medium subunit
MPHVGHLAIRARGTLGGSVALADPAAEIPACLVALDARIRVAGRGGTREVAAARFFRGVYTTDLGPGELVTEVAIPLAPGTRSCFLELARRHGDYALVAVAARARVTDGRLDDVRLALAGVGVTPVRAARAEAALAGRRADDPGAREEAGQAVAGEIDPPSDVHASAALRRHLARVLVTRAIAALAAGPGGAEGGHG